MEIIVDHEVRMMASINTLVEDVYRLLEEGTTEDLTEKANEFGNRLASLILDRLKPKEEKRTLRMSNIGKPDRMLWYEINRTIPKEEFNGPTYLKFLYGDLIEEVVLFLSEAAGHTVSDRQRQVTVDGIVGHIDAVIDGVLIDVKSTSPQGLVATGFCSGNSISTFVRLSWILFT